MGVSIIAQIVTCNPEHVISYDDGYLIPSATLKQDIKDTDFKKGDIIPLLWINFEGSHFKFYPLEVQVGMEISFTKKVIKTDIVKKEK